jgi:hypothetical protein
MIRETQRKSARKGEVMTNAMPITRAASLERREDIRALARWENEGGQVPATAAGGAGGHVAGFPALPHGHTTQVAWGFHAPSDGSLYEFVRVYGPAQELNGLGPIRRLDEDLSYWLTIFPSPEESVHQRLACRWVSYGHARTLSDRRLSFGRFSSPLLMRDELDHLMLRKESAAGQAPSGLTGLVEDVLPG